MAEDQVTLKIEGVDVTVPRGTTVLEAAKRAGILIPHYCYHPGLPVSGVCRMCLVTVEGAPGLQIACAIDATDGQVVSVFDSAASDARQAVLEFLLINHPLDCPICDQAGECELQDYVFQEGRARTRYSDYPKRFSPVEDFGGDVLYVPNRCILCTRCIRFMDHAAEESVLNVSERGDRAFIGIHPDAVLDHPWAGNVVDLCPVGSLISKDFLHKAYAWQLDRTPGICTGCSQGCNITVETRDNSIARLRPRTNEDVNRYFMCDHGRFEYRWMNSGDRIEAPLVAGADGLVATDWSQAIARCAEIVKGVSGKAVALVSPRASCESLYLVRQLLQDFELVSACPVEVVEGEQPLPGVPNLALRSERAPNVEGAARLGHGAEYDKALEAVKDAALVFVLDDGYSQFGDDELSGSQNLIYLGTSLPDAARNSSVVFPMSNAAEEDGTYVNRDGRVQRYMQAKTAPGMARPAWWITGALLSEIRGTDAPATAGEVFDRMAASESAFAGLSYETLGTQGAFASKASGAGVGCDS